MTSAKLLTGETVSASSEAWRAECEARYWLANGYNNRETVERLRQAIAKKRGQAAADRLISDMRRQVAHNRSKQ